MIMAARQWQVGDRAAVRQTDVGRYLYLSEDAARRMGITEDTPGWQFVEVTE